MTASASPLALDYAALGTGPGSWTKLVLRLSAIAAAVLAVAPCLHLLFAAYAVASGMVRQFDLELLVYFALVTRGPLLVWAAITAWRAATSANVPPRRMTLLFGITFAIAITTAVYRAAQSWHAGGLEVFRASVEASSTVAYHLCLLMPVLLIAPLRAERWQLSRATLLAVGVLLLSVPRGVSYIYWESTRIMERRDLAFADAIRAAIQQPMPIVGLWPLLCLAAAIALLASRGTGSRAAIRWAVVAGLVFNAISVSREFYWFRDAGDVLSTVFLRTTTVLDAAARLIGIAVPLVLLWWATRAPPLSTGDDDQAGQRQAERVESVA